MKGRTICPKCKHEFVLDVPDSQTTHDIICPKCENKFTIQTKAGNTETSKECFWEEHGEPRKTILSSIKPKTNKPMIAAILLTAVFVMGITTAVFSETFMETSLDALSNAGMDGTVELSVMNSTNYSLSNVSITINGINGNTNENGLHMIENVSLGVQEITFSLPGYKTLTCEILVTPVIAASHEIKMEEGTGQETILFNSIGCSAIFAIFAVFALLGAVSAYKRRNLDVAVAGSIIGIFCFGFLLIASILGIIAFIIIMMSKEEFDDGKKGKVF